MISTAILIISTNNSVTNILCIDTFKCASNQHEFSYNFEFSITDRYLDLKTNEFSYLHALILLSLNLATNEKSVTLANVNLGKRRMHFQLQIFINRYEFIVISMNSRFRATETNLLQYN